MTTDIVERLRRQQHPCSSYDINCADIAEAADEITRLRQQQQGLRKRVQELERRLSRYDGIEIDDLKECLAESQARETKLREKAQAVIDRWDSPLWKDLQATASYINELREVLNGLQ